MNRDQAEHLVIERPKIYGDRNYRLIEALVKIIPTVIAVTALPLMALGQTTDQQHDASKEQTNETQKKATPKKKRAPATQKSAERQAVPVKKSQTQTHASNGQTQANKSQTNSRTTQTKVNKIELKVAAPRGVHTWTASQGVCHSALRSNHFPVDRKHLFRLCGHLLGRS